MYISLNLWCPDTCGCHLPTGGTSNLILMRPWVTARTEGKRTKETWPRGSCSWSNRKGCPCTTGREGLKCENFLSQWTREKLPPHLIASYHSLQWWHVTEDPQLQLSRRMKDRKCVDTSLELLLCKSTEKIFLQCVDQHTEVLHSLLRLDTQLIPTDYDPQIKTLLEKLIFIIIQAEDSLNNHQLLFKIKKKMRLPEGTEVDTSSKTQVKVRGAVNAPEQSALNC